MGRRQLSGKNLGFTMHDRDFYSLVSRETKDQDFASKRQLFLTEQGYRYQIEIDLLLPKTKISMGTPAGSYM